MLNAAVHQSEPLIALFYTSTNLSILVTYCGDIMLARSLLEGNIAAILKFYAVESCCSQYI
jgi:hypothetical protein